MPEIKKEDGGIYEDVNQNYASWENLDIKQEYILPHSSPENVANEPAPASNDREGMVVTPASQNCDDLLNRLSDHGQNAMSPVSGLYDVGGTSNGGPAPSTSGYVVMPSTTLNGSHQNDFAPDHLRDFEAIDRDLYLKGFDGDAFKLEPTNGEYLQHLDPQSTNNETSTNSINPGLVTRVNSFMLSGYMHQLNPRAQLQGYPPGMHAAGPQRSPSHNLFTHAPPPHFPPAPYLGPAIALSTSSPQYNNQTMGYCVGPSVVSTVPSTYAYVAPGPSSGPNYTTAPASNGTTPAPTTTTSALAATDSHHTWGSARPAVAQSSRSPDSSSQQQPPYILPGQMISPMSIHMSPGSSLHLDRGCNVGAAGGGLLPVQGLNNNSNKHQGHGNGSRPNFKATKDTINAASPGVIRARWGKSSDGTSNHGGQYATCELCTARCASTGHLKRHKSAHGANRRFKCHVCDCSYSRQDNLKKHLSVAHSLP
ncbi:uncharacterized protein LOC143030247 isoform X2 [Oratosquilla oratoria]|uniref:uncharacterized protein LOC143030247 isoform X2 n=1 Tax=Oratosquilla oratoria TaxID=337810 RepID=UPI003F75C9C3